MKTYVQAILTLTVLAITANGGYAQPVEIKRIDLAEYGMYRAAIVTAQRDDKGVLQSSLDDIQHIKTTVNIPAQIGIRFGIRFTPVGTPKGAIVKLKKVVLFPAPLQPNSGPPISRSVTMLTAALGETQYTDYGFDDPWELVTGTWVIELWAGERKLASQIYTVFNPTTDAAK